MYTHAPGYTRAHALKVKGKSAKKLEENTTKQTQLSLLRGQLQKHVRTRANVEVTAYVDRYMELYDCGGLSYVSAVFGSMVGAILDFIYQGIYSGEIEHTNDLPLKISEEMWTSKDLCKHWAKVVFQDLEDPNSIGILFVEQWFKRCCALLLHMRFNDFLGDAIDEMLSVAGSLRTPMQRGVHDKEKKKTKDGSLKKPKKSKTVDYTLH